MTRTDIDESRFELDACPFCGGTPVLEWFQSRKGYEADIQCNACPADIHTITYDTPLEACQAAVKAWNRRAGPAFNDSIGKRIKARRGVRKISLHDLSRLSGMDVRRLEAIEAGVSPGASELAGIAHLLRCGISEFVVFPDARAAQAADRLGKEYAGRTGGPERKTARICLENACQGYIEDQSGIRRKEG